jgi:DNA-binding NarL/FixJ family response regulator
VVGTAADGREACELAERTTPDVILMDLSMPLMDGIEATRSIVASTPTVHVIVLTSFADRSRILAALDAGATGYLLKDADPAEVAAAIRAAVAGGVPLDPRAARVMLDAQRTVRHEIKLSARESEVLQLVVAGLANKSIARRLGITERTVKAHLTSVFQQLQVGDRTQAALWAKEHLTDDKPG